LRPLLSCAEASRLDAATASSAAIPSLILMEDAAVGLWRALEPLARERGAGSASLLLAVCGSGNNGGDALALLRRARFSGLTRLAAIVAGGRQGELSSLYSASLAALGLELRSWEEERGECERLLGEASLIVDGLSGTGLSGRLRDSQAALAKAASASGAAIASVDLPSGLSDAFEAGFPLVAASWTLSVEPRKACLYFPSARPSCGRIIPIEGVFPADAKTERAAFLLEAEDLPSLAPLPPDSAYKGERGRAAVFAGSPGASGAAVLASRACLAAGAGTSALYASPDLFPIVAPMLDSVMVKPEPEDTSSASRRWDALLVGPGWGRTGSRMELLASLLALGLPAVIDADGIGLFKLLLDTGFSASAPIILTPHPGEFAELSGLGSERSLANPASILPEFAEKLKAVIVLKSQVTWIAAPGGELAVWDGSESGLGTAGSGDVLAGLACGLLARRAARLRLAGGSVSIAEAFSAARAAVLAHGLAGRKARKERGWFEASAISEAAALILGGGE
jgi:ADP-dependent NAD(P)H-hydrate dehydratase / NAD(P)H-hydrate epimerase